MAAGSLGGGRSSGTTLRASCEIGKIGFDSERVSLKHKELRPLFDVIGDSHPRMLRLAQTVAVT